MERIKQKANIVSGIITEIEQVNESLSFVSLNVIGEEGVVSTKMPFYSKLNKGYIGRNIDFQTATTGRFSKTIEQKIIGSNFSVSITLPKSQINQINHNYAGV